MSYEIGYRRPPESGRFKKGKSGNPKGRPKGSTNFLTILEKELNQSIVVNENGKKKTITRMQAMVKRIVAGALQGDLKALMTLFEILRRTGKFAEAVWCRHCAGRNHGSIPVGGVFLCNDERQRWPANARTGRVSPQRGYRS